MPKRAARKSAREAVDLRLVVTARPGETLSRTQTQFNTLMRRLEKARARQQHEREQLDEMLQVCGRELMPLIDELHRLNHDMVILGLDALTTCKLTPRRRQAFANLLHHKASQLVDDPCGLTDEQVETMQRVVEELTGPGPSERQDKDEAADFEFLRFMAESAARQAGIDLDLSGLDLNGDPEEVEREMQARLDAALHEAQNRPRTGGARKPTKAQLERERRQQEAEEAKTRDLKSLYKQLAKVLHPDLEADPARRLQKEEWMKRLTAAYAAEDLRELLAIELEWMGAESSNLATATDEKLKVYCKVLKEQLDMVNLVTRRLLFEPQYAALHRFKHPYFEIILPISYHKNDLLEEVARHREMLGILNQGGPARAQLITRWAEDAARKEKQNACPF